jgi:hypothetical protein
MLIKLGVGILAAVSALTMALGIAVFQAGFATVEIESQETPWIYLPVPLAAVDIALAFVPEEDLAQARRDLEQFRPVIEAALAELKNCPDVTLVEVVNQDESVLIEKSGSELLIKVDNGEHEKVRIRVPVGGVQRTFAAIMG